MKTYDNIFFDLDGTLTDSGPGIMNGVRYALEKLGAPALPEATLRRFVGPPLHDSMQRFCGFTLDKAMHSVDVFREYYNVTGIFENSVYPGIEELLRALTDMGKRLFVATSKPKVAAERVLEHYELRKYFTFVAGATLDSSLVEKKDIIAHAMKNCGAAAENTLMVGDREHDIWGANANHMDSVGILWGYGSREELLSAGAMAVIETPMDLPEMLKNI